MDLYEYQARELLQLYDIPLHAGVLIDDKAFTPDSSFTFPSALKAQVRTGGRGLAGGVKIVHDANELRTTLAGMIGMNINGHKAARVLAVPAVKIVEEYYVSITFDRSADQYLLLLSKYGGVDIEKLAFEHPEDLTRYHFSCLTGLTDDICYTAARIAGFEGDVLDQVVQIAMKLWKAYKSVDATLVEINPLALVIDDISDTDSEKVYALDAKVSLDDNAKFRQAELFERFAISEEDNPLVAQARRDNLAYVHLEGSVGVIGNGAGLVMSTLDIVSQVGASFGVKAANFLDIGGGASQKHMQNALSLVLNDPQVKVVFINIFGGLTQCTLVAGGIIAAVENLKTMSPASDSKTDTNERALVVRFAGNEAKAGLKALSDAHLENVYVFDDQIEAARKAVEIAHNETSGDEILRGENES
ncbi:MAG: ADP-forming succinate--CoA ligase subunit beta [Candidatus Ancillula sp.]|jgi:succinyl-CoA synthetase beta subunit|nr:ADP-forming succinate--CoA ligase subunit beta [Candidatus Ancillula sp.]